MDYEEKYEELKIAGETLKNIAENYEKIDKREIENATVLAKEFVYSALQMIYSIEETIYSIDADISEYNKRKDKQKIEKLSLERVKWVTRLRDIYDIFKKYKDYASVFTKKKIIIIDIKEIEEYFKNLSESSLN